MMEFEKRIAKLEKICERLSGRIADIEQITVEEALESIRGTE